MEGVYYNPLDTGSFVGINTMKENTIKKGKT